MNLIYLDNNATTVIHPDVADAMHACHQQGLVNPESQHQLGRQSRRLLEDCREQLGLLLGLHLSDVHADHLFFTSGGTEANNLAIQGYHMGAKAKSRLVVSGIEHPSVLTTAQNLQNQGVDVQVVNTLTNGLIDCEHLESLVNQDTFLVAIMLANNETGVIQPIAEVVSICERMNIPIHVDAVQAIGKLDVQFRDLGVGSMTVSAHKVHGPRGSGALVTRHGHTPHPIFHGGFQQSAVRPGTESVALAVGLTTAVSNYLSGKGDHASLLQSMRNRLETGITSQLSNAQVLGIEAPRLPNTSNIAFRGLDRQAMLMALDVAGVCCSTGSACASGSSEPSPTLIAMGLDPELIEGALRFSLGIFNSEPEIDEAIERICAVASVL